MKKSNKKIETKSADTFKKSPDVSKIQIGISDKNSLSVANRLQTLLADEQIIYAKTRNYHWNLEGRDFMEMHLLFERLYTEIAETIDSVAERIRKIGHYSQGRLEDFLKQTNLLEGEYTNDIQTQIQNLLADHETVIRYLRNDINDFDDKFKDAGSADFVTGVLKQHEEWAWFLRSYLK
ncbi:MAG TPA: DNA starvation/stationary phase protection protein [Parafilimonas sp.]